jgi:hypothetical protein
LFACAKETPDDTGDAAVETDTDGGDGDGDAPADADQGDGDGDPGDGDGDPNNMFVPDDGDMTSINDCDPFAQDCPEGEKCVAYASTGGTWDANRCVAVTGEGSTGDPCVYQGAASGADDCDANNVCWNALDVDGVLMGTCFSFCTGGADNPVCEDADTSCRVVNDGAIAVCLPNCDPLLQDCPDALGCYWSGGSQTFQCIITAGGIPTGEPCGFNNDCNPGHFCADAAALETCNGSACCAVFCDLSEDPTTCVAPLDCVSFFEEGQAPPLYEDLGLCILPG